MEKAKVIETKTDLQETNVLQEVIETRLGAEVISEIHNHEEYGICVKCLKNLKNLMKQWEDKRKEIVFPLDLAKRKIQELFRGPADKMKERESLLKGKLADYDAKLEKKRLEEQRKLEAQAEKERQEKERQQREWENKERKKREEADKLAAEGREEEARKLREKADRDAAKAEERAEEAEAVVAPVIAKPEAPKGVSYRMKYTGEVVDFSILPDAYKVVNQGMLDRTISAQKGEIPIPGVKIIELKIVASSSR